MLLRENHTLEDRSNTEYLNVEKKKTTFMVRREEQNIVSIFESY